MKHEYTAYVREIDGQPFYFVKHFIVIPEVQNINPVLEGYGMHTQFEKACDIAGIIDAEERRKIYSAIQPAAAPQARIVSMKDFKSPGKKIS